MGNDPKSVLLRFYDAWSAGELDVLDELMADDMVEHEKFPGLEPSKEGVKQLFAIYRSAFPDLRVEVHETVAEGDLACARISTTGTHRGEFAGIAATGRRVEVETIDMVRVRDGRCVEHWGVTDSMTLLQQLGALPAPPA